MDRFEFHCPHCQKQTLVDIEEGRTYYVGTDGEINCQFDPNMRLIAQHPQNMNRLKINTYLIGIAAGFPLGVGLYLLMYDHLAYCPMSYPECRLRASHIILHALSLIFWLSVGAGVGAAIANKLAEGRRTRVTTAYYSSIEENKERNP